MAHTFAPGAEKKSPAVQGRAKIPKGDINVMTKVEPKERAVKTITLWPTVTSTRPQSCTPEEACELIANPETAREWVTPIRELYEQTLKETGDAEKAKKAVSNLKKELPAFQWSGFFEKRGDAHCVEYSGLLCADLDDLSSTEVADLRPRFEQDQHCATVFVSPSGHGLKPVFAVSPKAEDHTANFQAVQLHVKRDYAKDVDPSGRNPERLCFASYDPDCKWKADAVPLVPVFDQPEDKGKAVAQQKVPVSRAVKYDVDSNEDLDERAEIAERMFGSIDWQNDVQGFCTCPGIDQHTQGDGQKDCRVNIDGVPTLFCFHTSCKDAVDEANRELRRAVGKAERRARNLIILPSGDVSISDCARDIFERSSGLYMRGGAVTELVREKGIARLELVKPEGFRTRAERLGTLMAWRVGRDGEAVLKPAKMSGDDAKAILASLDARELLPPVASLVRCAVCTTDADGELQILGPGYHPELGGLLIDRGKLPPSVPLEKAVASLLWIFEEFDFQTPGDKSRAVAAVLTPAFRMGGFLRGNVPIDVAEANVSLAGKGYRHSVTCAIYGEEPYLISPRDGGVGSADESFASALIAARPFICLDNLRHKLDSTYLEAFLTAPGLFPARVPHQAEIMIDPSRFCLQLTSNGMESTRDLANRASICRIRKRPGYSYYDTLGYVRRRQGYFQGCVFSVINEWHRQGKPRTNDTRHDFRDWAQTLDWVVQELFHLVPLMDGHEAAQDRVSNPALSWLRGVALAVERTGRSGIELTASAIVELCQATDIPLPNLKPGVDDKTARQAAGCIMRRVFGSRDRLELEGFTVTRSEKAYQKPSGDWAKTPVYVFEEKP
jgi:hypothetical protein